jgi:SH3-like domain-containing protein
MNMRSLIFISIITMLLLSSTASAERWTVSVDKCNVRSGPGEKFEVIWQVEKYYPIDIVESKGEWRFFRDVEGDEGWIHADLIEKVESVVIKKDKCNIRSGPGTNFSITFVAEKGIPFKVVNRKNQWIQIEHADGDKGWVHESLVW